MLAATLSSVILVMVLLSTSASSSAMLDRIMEPMVGQTTVTPQDEAATVTEVMLQDDASVVTETMMRHESSTMAEATPSTTPDQVSRTPAAVPALLPLDLTRLADLTGITGFTGLTGLSGMRSLVEMVEAMAERMRRETTAPGQQATRFKKLLRLIEAGDLRDCAARVVCDLNCDADAFGADGKRVLMTLARLQSSGLIERKDMEFYVKAGVLGRKTTAHGDCPQVCLTAYPVCPAQSKDLVAAASLIRLRF